MTVMRTDEERMLPTAEGDLAACGQLVERHQGVGVECRFLVLGKVQSPIEVPHPLGFWDIVI